MILITDEHKKQLDELINMEVEHINRGFQINLKLGKYYVSNAISSFKNNYLKKVYGNVIPQLSTEYRTFLIGLLVGINDEYKPHALSEVLIPTVKEINDQDLLKIFDIK